MRIAACLSGMGRTAEYCRPWIERFFKGHDVDYFIHAWPNDTQHLKLFAPKAVSILEPLDLAEKERKVISTFREHCFIRLIPMYWGISEAIRLVPRGRYDLIVRLRPDIVPLNRINATLSDLKEDAVYFAYHMQAQLHAWRPPAVTSGAIDTRLAGFNDLMFFGTEASMRHFENCYDLLDPFCEEGSGLNFQAEMVLHYIIGKSSRPAVRAPISLQLIDEGHAKLPLELYEERAALRATQRREADSEYVRSRHPDLLPLFLKAPAPPSPQLGWFHRCWATGGEKGENSPALSAAALKVATKRYHQARTRHHSISGVQAAFTR